MQKIAFNKISGKAILCLLLVVLSDFFFYQEKRGWTVGIFGFALLGSILLRNNKHLSAYNNFSKICIFITITLLLSLFENVSTLSFFMAIIGLITVATTENTKWQTNAVEWFLRIRRFLLCFFFRIFGDYFKIIKIKDTVKKNKNSIIRNWLLPIISSAVFIMLFADANPIIYQFVNQIKIAHLFDFFSIKRVLLWLITCTFCWAIIRHRVNTKKAKRSLLPRKTVGTLIQYLFADEAIFRSLVIFNILFIIQNAVDINYLWIGTSIPQGVSIAQYVNEGAYTLILTAMLAAIFALIALKRNQNKMVRTLINIWVGQNILLVVSSIWRTLLYIENYSLTYLRVAGIVWMLLVALGLCFIIIRNVRNKSSLWLININVLSVLAILYVCCFINFGYFISQYNVRNCKEITGHGEALDIHYLAEIGTSSLPAIWWMKERLSYNSNKFGHLVAIERNLEYQLKQDLLQWKGWSFRNYRISQGIE